jgi:hypothetical protein
MSEASNTVLQLEPREINCRINVGLYPIPYNPLRTRSVAVFQETCLPKIVVT